MAPGDRARRQARLRRQGSGRPRPGGSPGPPTSESSQPATPPTSPSSSESADADPTADAHPTGAADPTATTPTATQPAEATAEATPTTKAIARHAPPTPTPTPAPTLTPTPAPAPAPAPTPAPALPPTAPTPVPRGARPTPVVPAPDDRDLVRHALGAVSAIVPVGLFAADSTGECWYVNQRLLDAMSVAGPESDELTERGDRRFHIEFDESDAGRRTTTIDSHPAGTPALLRIGQTSTHAGKADDSATATGPESAGQARDEGAAVSARVIKQLRPDGTTAGYVGIVVADPDLTSSASDGSGSPEMPSSPRLLHTFEPLLQILLDSTPDIITVLNRDGSWRYSNAAAWRLLGYQENFDARTGVFDLIHPDDTHLAVEQLADVLAGDAGPDDTFELRVRAQSGEYHYLESTANNLADDPVVHGIVIRSRDVTDQRAARIALLEANERMSTLVTSLHIAALVEDENRVIVLTNQAFLDLFELTALPARLVGTTLTGISAELTRRFGDPTRGNDPERVNRILRERRRALGDRLMLPDGRELERDYVPIYVDHEYRGHLWLFRDVSAQVRTVALSQQLLEVEREEKRRLLESEQVKASFLAEISHELRTPLTSILSFTELLKDGVGQDDPAEQVEFLDVITRNAERLMRLVDDLVLLDRAESGVLTVDWATIDVPTLVERSVSTFAPQADAKQISLESEIGEGEPIVGDAQKLAQMLDVLLSNAIKFTPETGTVTVTASAADAHWLISVTDTGIGVPATECEALFERFYRASNARAARIPGSGLGLSVARAIARLHDGEVSISNKEVGGAIALVALPIAHESPLALGNGGT